MVPTPTVDDSQLHRTFIKQYECAVPPSVCDQLIDSFLSSDQLVKRRNGLQNFDELNLNTIKHDYVVPFVNNHLKPALELYIRDIPQSRYFPSIAFEELRIKRYLGDTEQQFGDHVDVSKMESAKRYLAFLFYLNDDFAGGQTLFWPNIKVTPIKGSVVIFPPNWMYPHAGLPVRDGDKYILTSYLNFKP